MSTTIAVSVNDDSFAATMTVCFSPVIFIWRINLPAHERGGRKGADVNSSNDDEDSDNMATWWRLPNDSVNIRRNSNLSIDSLYRQRRLSGLSGNNAAGETHLLL